MTSATRFENCRSSCPDMVAESRVLGEHFGGRTHLQDPSYRRQDARLSRQEEGGRRETGRRQSDAALGWRQPGQLQHRSVDLALGDPCEVLGLKCLQLGQSVGRVERAREQVGDCPRAGVQPKPVRDCRRQTTWLQCTKAIMKKTQLSRRSGNRFPLSEQERQAVAGQLHL